MIKHDLLEISKAGLSLSALQMATLKSRCGLVTLGHLFIVMNSWGNKWANDNPLGLAGYALIPEDYINSPDLVGELLTPM